MHKYKIKRNHKQKLRYKFQFIHKNRNTLNNLAHFLRKSAQTNCILLKIP